MTELISSDLSAEKLSKLDRFLAIKAQLDELEEELENLKPEIYDLVTDFSGGIGYGGFEFQARERRTYTYSDGVRAAEEDLKKAKKYEEQEGLAALKTSKGYVTLLRKSV